MIRMTVDLSDILDLDEEMRSKINSALKEGAALLSAQAHAHIVEQVQEKLHSTRDKYIGALSYRQIDENTWVIALDQKAMWIEEGMPPHSMIDDMLKSPKAKTAKDGSRYLVVPFQHKRGPTSSTSAQQDLTSTIRAELKKRSIPYAGIEKDESGKPKTGLLHSFDINKEPPKTHQGPGQGHGPIGAVRQGNTGIPYLQGIRIYQREVKNRSGGTRIARDIMTFRVVSSKHKGTGKWEHPGLQARNFFEEAETWCLDQWPKIRDQILAQVTGT